MKKLCIGIASFYVLSLFLTSTAHAFVGLVPIVTPDVTIIYPTVGENAEKCLEEIGRIGEAVGQTVDAVNEDSDAVGQAVIDGVAHDVDTFVNDWGKAIGDLTKGKTEQTGANLYATASFWLLDDVFDVFSLDRTCDQRLIGAIQLIPLLKPAKGAKVITKTGGKALVTVGGKTIVKGEQKILKLGLKGFTKGEIKIYEKSYIKSLFEALIRKQDNVFKKTQLTSYFRQVINPKKWNMISQVEFKRIVIEDIAGKIDIRANFDEFFADLKEIHILMNEINVNKVFDALKNKTAQIRMGKAKFDNKDTYFIRGFAPALDTIYYLVRDPLNGEWILSHLEYEENKDTNETKDEDETKVETDKTLLNETFNDPSDWTSRWKIVDQPTAGWNTKNGYLTVNNNQLSGRNALIETMSKLQAPYTVQMRFKHTPAGMPAGGVRVRVGQSAEGWYEATARTDEDGGSSFLIYEKNGQTVWVSRTTAIKAEKWYLFQVTVEPTQITMWLFDDESTLLGKTSHAVDMFPIAPLGVRVGDANGGVQIDWIKVFSVQ